MVFLFLGGFLWNIPFIKQEKAQYCKWNCDSGFLLTSEIVNAIEAEDNTENITEDKLGDFIRQILESRCVK